MRYFHKLRNKFYCPIVNVDKLWSLVPDEVKDKACPTDAPVIDVAQFGYFKPCATDTTDHEMYVCLTCGYNEKYEKGKGCVGTQLVGERMKIILDEVQNLSLFTRNQCLQHLGEYFQPVMDGLENKSFSVVADAVLKDYIFVHLDNNRDKFNLLMWCLEVVRMLQLSQQLTTVLASLKPNSMTRFFKKKQVV